MDDELAENASSNLAALEHAKEVSCLACWVERQTPLTDIAWELLQELEKEIRLTVDQCQELFAQRQRLQEALKPALEEKEKIDRYFANKQSQEEEINVRPPIPNIPFALRSDLPWGRFICLFVVETAAQDARTNPGAIEFATLQIDVDQTRSELEGAESGLWQSLWGRQG